MVLACLLSKVVASYGKFRPVALTKYFFRNLSHSPVIFCYDQRNCFPAISIIGKMSLFKGFLVKVSGMAVKMLNTSR